MKLTLLLSLFFFFGCTTNLPYVDINDVSSLEPGMNRETVEKFLGNPIKISANANEEVWLYEYRELENSRLEYSSPVKGRNPQIVGSPTEFYCVFNDDRLTKWGSCFDGCGAALNEKSGSSFLGTLNKIKWPVIIGIVVFVIKSLASVEEGDEFEGCEEGYYDCGDNECCPTS